MLLLRLANPSKGRKSIKMEIKAEPFPNTELPIYDKYTIVDAVMQIPLTPRYQIQIYVYEYQGKQYLDIRRYHYSYNLKVFQPTEKGIRFPIEFLPQLIIRLQRLQSNKNKFELKL